MKKIRRERKKAIGRRRKEEKEQRKKRRKRRKRRERSDLETQKRNQARRLRICRRKR